MANEQGKAQSRIVLFLEQSAMWHIARAVGESCEFKYIWMCLYHSRCESHLTSAASQSESLESSCLGMQLKLGGKPHLMLNTDMRPIANKYREGKLKRTLKREWTSTWNRWGANAKVIKSYMIFSWCFWINALIIWRRWDGLSTLDSSFEKVAMLA